MARSGPALPTTIVYVTWSPSLGAARSTLACSARSDDCTRTGALARSFAGTASVSPTLQTCAVSASTRPAVPASTAAVTASPAESPRTRLPRVQIPEPGSNTPRDGTWVEYVSPAGRRWRISTLVAFSVPTFRTTTRNVTLPPSLGIESLTASETARSTEGRSRIANQK